MSTILKALKRLEQERNSLDRPLRDEITRAEDPPERTRRSALPAVGLAALVGVAVGAGLLLLWPSGREAREAPAVVSAPAPAPAARAAAPPPPAEPPLPTAAEAAGMRAEPLAAAPRDVPGADVALVEVVERAKPPAPAPPPSAAPAPPAPPPARAAAAAPEPIAARAPAPAPEPARRPARVEAGPAPAPAARAAAEPSPVPAKIVRAPIPDVRVKRTSWHPVAGRRTALVALDGARPVQLHEGDAVGPLVVGQIEPSGVVFDHDGVEVHRRIGD